MDWSVLIPQLTAIVTAIIALVSPWIVATINHKHEEKMQTIKFHEEQKAKAIHNFIKSIGEALFQPTVNLENNRTGESFGLIYLYTSEELWPDIDRLLELYPFTYKEYEAEGTALFLKLCKKLKESTPDPDQIAKKHRKIVNEKKAK